jgi:hypothetical protein
LLSLTFDVSVAEFLILSLSGYIGWLCFGHLGLGEASPPQKIILGILLQIPVVGPLGYCFYNPASIEVGPSS